MDNLQMAKELFVAHNRSHIGKEIRKFRKMKKLSQKQLAKLMEISRPTISKIENGKFAISVNYLAKFAWHLDFSISLKDESDIIFQGE